jgi:hypothetical protein
LSTSGPDYQETPDGPPVKCLYELNKVETLTTQIESLVRQLSKALEDLHTCQSTEPKTLFSDIEKEESVSSFSRLADLALGLKTEVKVFRSTTVQDKKS